MLDAVTIPLMSVEVEKREDSVLVQRLKSRDKNAMEDLLRWHGDKLYGVAMQITRNETDAREAMQDALINIWNKIGNFEGRSAFTSWMYRVTANAALMKLRTNKRFEQHVPLESDGNDHELPALQLADSGDNPATTTQRAEVSDRVRAAIDALPEPYRTTVLLADVDEMSMDEVADAMNVTVAAVKSRLHRARLSLREVLKPYLGRGSL